MEVRKKWDAAAKRLGFQKKPTDVELKAQIDALGETIGLAAGIRRLLNNNDWKHFNSIIQSCSNNALMIAKHKTGIERDEAVGKLKMMDDINETINNVLKEGDKALLRQKELENIYYSDSRKQERG